MIQLPSDNSPDKVLGHPPTEEEVYSGKARWCWTCGNAECQLSKQDKLMMCLFFDERSREDMESDPHFGGHGNE